jgi:ribonuclease HII
MLLSFYQENGVEAGCDEAGRGCLAGPVFAAAVILPPGFKNELLNDSKQLTEKQRYELRVVIESCAVSYAIAQVDNVEIDEINILNASILAMHKALEQLKTIPERLLIDGNRFKKYKKIPHHCIIKGDEKYMAIAAASVLAKTYRDDFMIAAHERFPMYHWHTNKGYPTQKHRDSIREFGTTDLHRNSFRLLGEEQLLLDFTTGENILD